ncbi:DUF4017 family protein [Mesobacillus subterraneus]|uniref:DUF4017 domain-containing protein n=1 Tax=Mesobacillus subterraneus TaxID=285983 RepID=A0A3R9EBY3_9BACI|nr:DUF4017 family protein [Mesobacillus subterraneus]RSD26890.1 DUF4017 domain-containing protein [Mesobacillus subterraneus]
MKKILLPIVAYLIVCVLVVFMPASEGYNTVGWKLFVGQVYAIPVLLIGVVWAFFRYKSNASQ